MPKHNRYFKRAQEVLRGDKDAYHHPGIPSLSEVSDTVPREEFL